MALNVHLEGWPYENVESWHFLLDGPTAGRLSKMKCHDCRLESPSKSLNRWDITRTSCFFGPSQAPPSGPPNYCFRKKALYSRGAENFLPAIKKQKKWEPCGGSIFLGKNEKIQGISRQFRDNFATQKGRFYLRLSSSLSFNSNRWKQCR